MKGPSYSFTNEGGSGLGRLYDERQETRVSIVQTTADTVFQRVNDTEEGVDTFAASIASFRSE